MIQPLLIGAGVGLSLFGAGVSYATMVPSCQWFGRVLCHGDRNGPKRLALTFDDGPTPVHTEQVMRVLERHDVPASFFCIGLNAAAHPALLREVHEAGHLIANHSYDHAVHGAFHGRRYWVDQIQHTNDAIEQAIGRVPRFFRPPMGIKTPRVLDAPKQLGMVTVNWSNRGFDTVVKQPSKVAKRVTRNLAPGGVVLLHDGMVPGLSRRVPTAAEALPEIIESARAMGYSFDRLDRVLDQPGYIEST